MKKLSSRDWAIASVIGILFFVVGWAVSAIWHNKPPVQIENPLNTALIKRGDSLEAVIVQRDLIIANNDKQQFKHDSIIIKNNKALKKDYDKIKNLNDSTRSAYIDSVLKLANIRR
jgi:hypothetical protein